MLRVSPNHVHVGDPKYYHTYACPESDHFYANIDGLSRIYNTGNDYLKAPELYDRLGLEGAILTIIDPDQHKKYRSTVSPLFSKKASDDIGSALASEVQRAAELVARQGKEGKPTVIQRVYRAIGVGEIIRSDTEAPIYKYLTKKFRRIWFRSFSSSESWG